eukprot:1804323-Rhodomonas_salina.3
MLIGRCGERRHASERESAHREVCACACVLERDVGQRMQRAGWEDGVLPPTRGFLASPLSSLRPAEPSKKVSGLFCL